MKYSICICPRDRNKKSITSRFMELYVHKNTPIDFTALERKTKKICADFSKITSSVQRLKETTSEDNNY